VKVSGMTISQAVSAEIAAAGSDIAKKIGLDYLYVTSGLESSGVKNSYHVHGVSKSNGLTPLVASFALQELPGCCGVVVSYHVSVQNAFQGKGVGDALLKIRMAAAKKANYTLMQATTVRSNDREAHLLEKNGFVRTTEFSSRRTGSTVVVWQKILE
jgi:GNAT superfamily N-acetyltransferase